MLSILLLTWIVIQLVAAIRSREPVSMVIAIVGIVLAVLHCMGLVKVACL